MSAINKIKAGSFAEACYNHNTLEELQHCKIPDCEDMQVWGITAAEWTHQIELAIEALEEKAATLAT